MLNPFDPLADPAATAARRPSLQHAPATARNRGPICDALAELLPTTPCSVLEVVYGTGEHALWMARELPHVTWQPADLNLAAMHAQHIAKAAGRHATLDRQQCAGSCRSRVANRGWPVEVNGHFRTLGQCNGARQSCHSSTAQHPATFERVTPSCKHMVDGSQAAGAVSSVNQQAGTPLKLRRLFKLGG